MIFSASAAILAKPPGTMKKNRLLLCTDMDRTVIPNGNRPEHPRTRSCFRAFCALPEVSLVYVTGRHRELVNQAVRDYDLPVPDYVIADVGTKIYRIIDGAWRELNRWEEWIAEDWQGKSHRQLKASLHPVKELILQEESKQNSFKLSYYLALDADRKRVLAETEQRLHGLGVAVNLIWSVDELKQVGLLDILPKRADKLHGIRFLQEYLDYQETEVVFAGDSGNDLPVLASSIRSVLVANADEEIKKAARQLAEAEGHADALYLATDDDFFLGGNYSAGVLQGVRHFVPEFREQLRRIELSL